MKLIDGAIFGDPDQGEVAPVDLEPTIDDDWRVYS